MLTEILRIVLSLEEAKRAGREKEERNEDRGRVRGMKREID